MEPLRGHSHLTRYTPPDTLLRLTLQQMTTQRGTFIVDVRRESRPDDVGVAAHAVYQQRLLYGGSSDPSLMTHDKYMALGALSEGALQAYAIGTIDGDAATVRFCALVNAVADQWTDLACALKLAKVKMGMRRLAVLAPNEQLAKALQDEGFQLELNKISYVY